MSQDTVMIFTNQLDPHADIMIERLNALGVEVVRLNTQELVTDVECLVDLREDKFHFEFFNRSNDRKIESGKIKSIWWRRPFPISYPDYLTKEETDFANKEYGGYLNAIWSLTNCYWIDHPWRLRQSSHKIEQLVRARQMGFKIPSTLVSKRRDQIEDFYQQNKGRIIYKVLSDPLLETEVENGDLMVKTTLVTPEIIDGMNHLELVPCLFQKLEDKQHELRITVIGDEVFAAEIHSQTRPETSLDWRDYTVEIPYKKAKVPLEFEKLCLAYVRSYGLNYSAMDFIYTPEGEYIFLENNPAGQFIFVEIQVPELKMIDALAWRLTKGLGY